MVVRSANPGKAVETAALWKAVEKRQESSERPSIHFSTESTALGKRLRGARSFPTVTHRFYCWTNRQIRSGALSGTRNRSVCVLLTGIQRTGFDPVAVHSLHGGIQRPRVRFFLRQNLNTG